MLSTQLVNYLGTTLYPMVEGAVYLDANNIGNIEFTPDTLYIIEGIINPAETTEYVFPEGCILKFNHNSYFGNNVTLRFVDSTTSEVASFTVVAPLQKIFDGTRIIGFFQNDEIPVEWFGAVGDGLTDDSAAINACIKYSAMQTVLLGANSYYVESTILFVESNWEAETFANTHSADKWPVSKSFICKGVIIGAASLDPVMIVYQGANIIDINTIQVLNTNADSRGIVILSICNQKLKIGKILKVNNSAQGIPIPSSYTLPTKRSGYAVILGGYLENGTFEFGLISGFDYGICFSSTHTGDMNTYIGKKYICQVRCCTFYILSGIQNTSYPISNNFTTFNTGSSNVPYMWANNIYINGGINTNDFNNDKGSSLFSNPATYIDFKYTGINSQVIMASNNIISNTLFGYGLRYMTLDWGVNENINTNLGTINPWDSSRLNKLKTKAYESNFPDTFNEYTDYNIIDLRRQSFTTINAGKRSYQPVEIVSYLNCVNTEITNMTLYNTNNILFDKVIFTRDNRAQEILNKNNIWERRLLGTTTWDDFINNNNISVDSSYPENQALYDFVINNDPTVSLQDISTDKSLAEYIFVRKSLTDLVIHERSCANTSIIQSFNSSFTYDNTIILIEPHYKHLQDIEYVSELPVTRDINKWYAVPVTNHGILPKYKVYIYDTVNWIGEVEGTPNLYFYKKYDTGLPNDVIDTINSSITLLGNNLENTQDSIDTINSSITLLGNDIEDTQESIDVINSSIAVHDTSILNITSAIETIDDTIDVINTSIATHDASIVYILGQL